MNVRKRKIRQLIRKFNEYELKFTMMIISICQKPSIKMPCLNTKTHKINNSYTIVNNFNHIIIFIILNARKNYYHYLFIEAIQDGNK